VCSDGDVRLMDGNLSSSDAGRVEVCIGNVYGTVCNDRWDESDATVVCRQLGKGLKFSSFLLVILTVIIFWGTDVGEAIAVRDGVRFGSNTATIFLDDVVCKGNEANLLQCSLTRQHNCDLSDIVGVICDGMHSTILPD